MFLCEATEKKRGQKSEDIVDQHQTETSICVKNEKLDRCKIMFWQENDLLAFKTKLKERIKGLDESI